jgi:hypothetical protein
MKAAGSKGVGALDCGTEFAHIVCFGEQLPLRLHFNRIWNQRQTAAFKIESERDDPTQYFTGVCEADF